MNSEKPPLIVITGPTASGKSNIAMTLAKQYDGEIICADSRTVYRGLDIGTAKPTLADQREVRHWLLDVVYPGERFTAADFQRLASLAISDIRSRNKIPLMVGGTGLYIDSVALGYKFKGKADEEIRERYGRMSENELISMLKKRQIEIPKDSKNKRRLIRALEQNGVNHERSKQIPPNTYVVSISTDKHILEQRIRCRAEDFFSSDVVSEAIKNGTKFGWNNEAMTGNIYSIIHKYHYGEITLEQAKELFITADRQLAKKQLTWLKRHEHVITMPLDEAQEFLKNILVTYRKS